MKKVAVAAVLVLSAACSKQQKFLPDNDLYKQDPYYQQQRSEQTLRTRTTAASGIPERTFHAVIDYIVAIYEPAARSQGATLVVNANWRSSEVNAEAGKEGTQWHLNFFGGLARRPEISADAFAMVVCHELGHLFAGAPYYPDSLESVEGQSDYFATGKCARDIWRNMNRNLAAVVPGPLPDLVMNACNAMARSALERDICLRSNYAGLGLASLLAVLDQSPLPQFTTPDPSVVKGTYAKHPNAQCRLDTLFAGTLWRPRPRCWFDPADDPGRTIADAGL